MSKRTILSTMIMMTACLLVSGAAIAQESQVVHFQGLLTGPDGGPLRTDTYDINFSIWDQLSGGQEPLWSEMQVVEVTEGLFDVFLGNVNALSADVFTYMEGDSDLRFLQIQVEGDDPMTPRTQIGKTPNSFVSSRVLGDVLTGPGSLKLIDPVDEREGFVALADNSGNYLRLMDLVEDGIPLAEMAVDAAQSSFRLMDPVDKREGFVALSDATGNSMKLMDPGDDGLVGLEMMVDGNGSNLNVNLGSPPDDQIPGVEIMTSNTGPAGNQASFRMFNPQPEPPATDPVIELKTMPNDAAYFAMNNLSGAEIGPLLEMTTDPTASSRIKIHAAQPTFSGRVEIQAEYTDGANMTMFREGPELHNEIKAMDLRVASDIGGEFNIFNYSSDVEQQLLAISGSPSAGGSFRMFNPQPEPPAELLLEMNTTEYGAKLAMAAPAAGGLRTQIDNPVMEISSGLNDVASIYMFNPQPEPPAVLTSMVSSMEGASLSMYEPSYDGQGDLMFDVFIDAQGASISLSDEIGKYMGVEPVPFYDGGLLKMFDPVTDNTMVSLGSNGHITAHNGTFGPNTNTGTYSLALGEGNISDGDNSFAGGRVAQANHDNCFVWSDYPFGPAIPPTQTSADNQFLVRATGGVAFYSNATFTSGVALGPGASSWSSIVPPGPDLNIRPVDGEEILSKIEKLPVKYYSHKNQEAGVEHLGPLPGDFNGLFGFDGEDAYISMGDESGVALAGVKALLERIEMLEARIAQLEAERR